MVKKAVISVVESGMSQVYELVKYLEILKSDSILQLRFCNAVEGLKAHLIKERYGKEIKVQKNIGLHSLIWN